MDNRHRAAAEYDLGRARDRCLRCNSSNISYKRVHQPVGIQLLPLACKDCFFIFGYYGHVEDRLYYLFLFIKSKYVNGREIRATDEAMLRESVGKIYHCESMYQKLYNKLETIYGTARMQILLYITLFIEDHIDREEFTDLFYNLERRRIIIQADGSDSVAPQTRSSYIDNISRYRFQSKLQLLPSKVNNVHWYGNMDEWIEMINRNTSANTHRWLRTIDVEIRRPGFRPEWLDSLTTDERWTNKAPLMNGRFIIAAGTDSPHLANVPEWFDLMAAEFDVFNKTFNIV